MGYKERIQVLEQELKMARDNSPPKQCPDQSATFPANLDFPSDTKSRLLSQLSKSEMMLKSQATKIESYVQRLEQYASIARDNNMVSAMKKNGELEELRCLDLTELTRTNSQL